MKAIDTKRGQMVIYNGNEFEVLETRIKNIVISNGSLKLIVSYDKIEMVCK